MDAEKKERNSDIDQAISEKESFWSLENFKEKMLALKFARSIENIFGVYIGDPLNQIYTRYFLEVYTDHHISILLSTDPYSDAIFDGVTEDCLKSSRLWVFPGAFFGKPNFKFLLAKMSSNHLSSPERLLLPSKILSGLSPNYMPIITNEDLCEFQQKTPCLNLKFIDLNRLRDTGVLPPIKMNDLSLSMSEKIQNLVGLGC